jgi:dihydrofolate reductase
MGAIIRQGIHCRPQHVRPRGVTDGIESALTRAREAPGDGDVSIHGGAATINQYLTAGLIDEVRLHIVPFTLCVGTRLFDGVPALTSSRWSRDRRTRSRT